tara:strand:+ start:2180 stop:2914 length:735 start_codon:yes stop_codon:yes gene_type:complete
VPEEYEADMESTYVDTPESSIDVPEEPGESYTITVDGVDEQVSLEELQNGYQRQSDYTRKTQVVAAERERLRQAEQIVSALEHNPEETLRTLARSFDMDLGQPASSSESYDWGEGEDVDPNAQKIAALEYRLEQSENRQRQEAIERQVTELQEHYGEFDSRELLSHALRHKIPNLEAAYTHWQFNEVKNTANKLQQEQELVSKKRGAAAVEPGGSTQTGTEPKTTSRPASIREAFAQAKEQLST